MGYLKVKQILMEVYQDTVRVSYIDFNELYNKPDNISEEFDQDFYNEVLNKKNLFGKVRCHNLDMIVIVCKAENYPLMTL